jgi:hypothetical protein
MDECLEIADDTSNDIIRHVTESGRLVERVNHNTFGGWLMSRGVALPKLFFALQKIFPLETFFCFSNFFSRPERRS